MGEVPRTARATMSLWEYKVLSSGRGGFATPVLLEKFLNELGRDEWEIIEFHTQAENALAFTGLARRPTQRDWTLEDAAAAAAKSEAEKLRAEFEAKFKAATGGGAAAAEEPGPSFLEEKSAPDDGFRKPVDTTHDADADSDEEAKEDEWEKLAAAEEDELPVFFDAIKPHLRRNQRGVGMSVGVDYLARKWDQSEDDLKGALLECGFTMPEDEDAKPVYVEFDGDLYWLNVNRRGELWLNTKEKPRPVFRVAKAQPVTIEEEAKPQGQAADRPRSGDRRRSHERGAGKAAGGSQPGSEDRESASGEASPPRSESGAPAESEDSNSEATAAAGRTGGGAALPEGPALLAKIRPQMRRNRRGPGGSGSTSFLSRALRCSEADLVAAFATLGLVVPETSRDKSQYVEIGEELWWLNRDSRGGVWINGREKRKGETAVSAQESETPASAESSAPESAPPAEPTRPELTLTTGDRLIAGARLSLKKARGGAVAGGVVGLAAEAGRPVEEFLAALVDAGLKVPEKSREKPAYAEHMGELFWLSRNAKGEIWLNAKPSKSTPAPEKQSGDAASADQGENKPRRRGGRSKKADGKDAGVAEDAADAAPAEDADATN